MAVILKSYGRGDLQAMRGAVAGGRFRVWDRFALWQPGRPSVCGLLFDRGGSTLLSPWGWGRRRWATWGPGAGTNLAG